MLFKFFSLYTLYISILIVHKHVNKRRKHVLQIKKHINYLHDFQRQFVLVPADKAANNVIVVCKK